MKISKLSKVASQLQNDYFVRIDGNQQSHSCKSFDLIQLARRTKHETENIRKIYGSYGQHSYRPKDNGGPFSLHKHYKYCNDEL